MIVFVEEPFDTGFLGGSWMLRSGPSSKSSTLFDCKCLFAGHFDNYSRLLVILDKTIYWAKGYDITDIVYWVVFESVSEKISHYRIYRLIRDRLSRVLL